MASEFSLHTIAPKNHPAAERIKFSVELPSDWQQVNLPAEEVDFSEPDKSLPLAVFTAPLGAAVFTAAARPAFEDGAVSQWVEFICQKQGVTITERTKIEARFGPALLAGATQPSDAGELTLRMVFVEDGGALIQFAVIAPTVIFPSLEEALMHSLASVLLLSPQGPTHPLVQGEAAEKPEAAVSTGGESFKEFVNAGNLDALEETNKLTAYFRDNGIGLVPRVHEVNQAEGYATLAAGAVQCFFCVPLGWHVIDDTRRTLIFDKGTGGTQINLALVQAAEPDAIFDRIEQETAVEQPGIASGRHVVEGIPTLAFKGIKVDGETLDQVFLLCKHPQREDVLIKVRVTVPPEATVQMLNLTGLIAKSVR